MSATSKKQKDTYISKTAITRIIKDVRQLEKNPLASHGIYIINMIKMICLLVEL